MASQAAFFLHAVRFVPSGLRAEEARGGSEGHGATVSVQKATDGIHAPTSTADDSAASDAAAGRGLSPGAFPLAASDDIEESAKSSSITCRAASNAADGPASASAARCSDLESRTTLRRDEVKVSILFGTNLLKDGVSSFSHLASLGHGGFIEGRIAPLGRLSYHFP
jgi:hypothetical protein